ncbi:hypothetical protein EVAR_69162_1 [Eumeta japonica]|uniref:Integrase zinc-binding domain-containing protein n=1 Tax=Eumeta variegata TaxID=151549 RepID=A0A4C1ZHB2_EUMVA|nr:hypothetical protein EVAR_69162_1 [Eumeta japonica]
MVQWARIPARIKRLADRKPIILKETGEEKILHPTVKKPDSNILECIPNIDKFSKWSKLIRSTACVLQFIRLCRKNRVKNRPRRRLNRNAKHPPILSGDHHITRLYIEHTHRQLHHAGAEATINECRQRYYITRIRTVTRDIIRRCIPCRIKRESALTSHGDHLSNRLAHHRRPSPTTGIDYFGPLTVKIGRTTNKRYVVLFTCLTTRAIHLEIAASLETSSAIL